MPHQKLVEELHNLYSDLLEHDQSQKQTPLIENIVSSSQKIGILFAGQGFDFMTELSELYTYSPAARRWIVFADELLEQWIQSTEVLEMAMFSFGLHPKSWIEEQRSPPMSYLQKVSVTHPFIFITQIARFLAAHEQGLSRAFRSQNVSFLAGYSQGMLPTLFIAEQLSQKNFSMERAGAYLQYTFWQGVIMENHWQRLNQKELIETTPMVGISGIERNALEQAINKVRPILEEGEHLTIAIQATRTRFVISGPARAIAQLRTLLDMQKENQEKKKKQGLFGGNIAAVQWELVPVKAAFHNEMMRAGIQKMKAKCQEMGFEISHKNINIPIICYDSAQNLSIHPDILDYLLECQFVLPVHWFSVMCRVAREKMADYLVDLGPGDGLTRICASTLRGSGIEVIPLRTNKGQERLFSIGAPAPTQLRYDRFQPQLTKTAAGGISIENAFTLATGRQPIILPGMTPTTADVDIVAAAANAGYVAELAGGGQVNETIFWKRMEELRESIHAGQGVVFNALYLDRYLWGLHFSNQNLVIKARQAGYPICGVTISAGIPELEEAVRLFRNFHKNGIWLNALKAGNVPQVKQIIQIAKELPEQKIFLHLEGGKAGGHHSWEDLDQLLLDSYHLIRDCENLILCVGGGVGNQKRATDLLLGTWAQKYGLISMPVDAIFLGTICMATKEAKTSPQVKKALVETQGTSEWVYAGDSKGQMTSGKSQLNADIHYIDNFAAECGRILDSVAGNAEAVANRKEEIIAALNKTAKPYFGHVQNMTYEELLRRMLSLLAVGTHDRYEDGIWPDTSFRERFADMLWRTEARLHPQQEGEFTSILSQLKELDQPEVIFNRFLAVYPNAKNTLIHPADAEFFFTSICKRPGKPVNFVPVIDEDVRRWYKSDSLWFSHDPRFAAEQVLVIPGPEAVEGIDRENEPIAELFSRFLADMISNIEAFPSVDFKRQASRKRVQSGISIVQDAHKLTVYVESPEVDWFSLFPTLLDAGMLSFWSAGQVLSGDRLEENIVRKICIPQKGSQLHITENQLICHPFPKRNAWISIEETKDKHILVQIYDIDLCGEEVPLLSQHYQPHIQGGEALFRIEASHRAHSIMDLYHNLLFQSSIPVTPLFSTATDEVSFSEKELQGYLSSLGERGVLPPLNFMFSLGWKPIFSVLSCTEIRGGLLDLVHLSNDVEAGVAWPPKADEILEAQARIIRLETKGGGQAVSVELNIHALRGRCATLNCSFYIRRAPHRAMPRLLVSKEIHHTINISEKTECALLTELSFLNWNTAPAIGSSIEFVGTQIERHPWDQQTIYKGTGSIFFGDTIIGSYSIDERSTASEHPLDRLFALFTKAPTKTTPVKKLISEETCWAPSNMAGYAQVSRDQNPIHQSELFANLAGLEAPIVHGMWTAGKMLSLLRQSLRDDAQFRIQKFQVFFDSPLPLAGELRLEAWKTGYANGMILAEVRAFHMADDSEVSIARANASISPIRTAYIFPGQGIQEMGMGMDLYKTSPAAREIWNRADAHTRAALGFSILRVVQKNPKILRVQRSSFRHPQGILHLTQFTQVAMATMAQAQVAWMKEEGIFIPNAVTCGHSVGEYNAISAVLNAIPLENIISVVWHRGLTMHSLVERDEKGRSAYKMGVIRPHYAKMNHKECEQLVLDINKKTGYFLEIVNFNVRGRQYSVTGEIPALEALEEALQQRNQSNKKAYIEVPGIDVPFHSRLLTKGVDDFRRTLEQVFPSEIDPEALVHRYIPNLTATAFTLSKAFVQEILDVVDSKPMKETLTNWEEECKRPSILSRKILVELLAWQFASPVRWIETQELMFSSSKKGGMGLQEIIEVGSGKQPTLANMARYSLTLNPIPNDIRILNIEAEKDLFFGVDTAPEPKAKTTEIVAETPVGLPKEPNSQPIAPAPQRTLPVTSSLPNAPVTHLQGLQFLIAKQANLKPDQIQPIETIEEIFEGVSSKRNQLLLDLGSEFSVGTIDGAHEKSIFDLSETLKDKSPSWSCGPYIQASIEETCKKVFGRANLSQSDIDGVLSKDFSLPEGLLKQAWMLLCLENREGTSVRGGSLGSLASSPADKNAATGFIDSWMNILGSSLGLGIGRQKASGGGTSVDSALLDELKDSILGPDGVLMKNAQAMVELLGHDSTQNRTMPEEDSIAQQLKSVLSEEYAQWVAPIFDPQKHAPFISVWAAAHGISMRLLHNALIGDLPVSELQAIADRLSAFSDEERVRNTTIWNIQKLRECNREDLIPLFERILKGSKNSPLPLIPSRPNIHINATGIPIYEELNNTSSSAPFEFVESYCQRSDSPQIPGWKDALLDLISQAGSFSELTVLITGASPGSIAVEIMRQLLRGNARVIVTTTSCHAKRMRFYRDIYDKDAGPHAQLHVLPYNQASIHDSQALVDWLFESDMDLRPNLILPFGAAKAYGSLADITPGTEASMRAMLTGVESLISGVGVKMIQEGGGHCHVILPLSPNHGIFGGDGLYAESKAGLEVLLNKCQSEQNQWAKHVSICGAVIGWVRGTGLMNANNIVAKQLEERLAIQTFSPSEMGLLIAGLCQQSLIDQCTPTMKIDLSGGLMHSSNLSEEVDAIRTELDATSTYKAKLSSMRKRFQKEVNVASKSVPALPFSNQENLHINFSNVQIPLSQQVVIVGYGEIGPCGSARTRFEMELQDELAPGAVAELAWITGMIRYENNSWVDTETSQPVDEADISKKYRSAIEECTGIRILKPETLGFNTQAVETWVLAYLDKSYRFAVSSKEDALNYQSADPEKTQISCVEGEWFVQLLPGAQIRLPKHVQFSRSVGGSIPDGFDFSRYGIPQDMQDSVDRLTLFNIVATVDAWISSGLTPEELMEHLHPARIGNTQSSGIGGMRSLTRLYTDPVLNNDRQNDILQETLLNVMSAYVVQSYVGSYGPMSHPVGACATAALSVESGMEKIVLGKADFVVAGGFDDLGIEGMFGFADMNATAPTQEMLDQGFEPKEFSRPNDIRRGGFVESQGGGTLLLTRGDIALKMGLSVLGVLGVAGSYSDGIHRSIPAPGRGLLAMATGKEQSTLSNALTRFGLSVDDIGVIYKHDTSTTANDVNENEIHHRIQNHLGRTAGNPLLVVSQKSITGHSKGGAAAWQLIGLCQALTQQRLPGNRNLSCVDPKMREFSNMCFINEDLQVSKEFPIRAGMITSLGFGHVSAGILVVHPSAFLSSIPKEDQEDYLKRSQARKRRGERRWEEIRMGKKQAFTRVQNRRFRSKDGTKAQALEESNMLLNPNARLQDGLFES